MTSFKDMMNAQVFGTDKIKSVENYLTADYSEKTCAAYGVKRVYHKNVGYVYVLPDGKAVNRSDAYRWVAAEQARDDERKFDNFIDLIA